MKLLSIDWNENWLFRFIKWYDNFVNLIIIYFVNWDTNKHIANTNTIKIDPFSNKNI